MSRSLAGWLEENPKAANEAKKLLARGHGSRTVIQTLQRDHGCPYRDHTALQKWARVELGAAYRAATDKARGTQDSSKRRHARRLPDFTRTDADLRRLEKRRDFFVTCAVEEAYANTDFLKAVLHWCRDRKAQLVVNPVKYINPTRRREEDEDREERWWDPRLRDFMLDNEIRPHSHLSLMTTKSQATANNPLPARLSGRTKHRSAIFGHPQLAMRTVATPQTLLPKILYSSGAITEKNYSDTMAGDMGAFHHSLGGIIVEVRGDRFHLREVTWDGLGFADCDSYYTANGRQENPRVEALVMGDVHTPHYTAENVMAATFDGPESIVAALKPRRLFLHDLADNLKVNPHEANNRLSRAAAARRHTTVEDELRGVADWLRNVAAEGFDEILVVPSNHDDFLDRWLQRGTPDPHDAKLFHYLCFRMLEDEEVMGEFPLATELALRFLASVPSEVSFLRPDQSYQVGGVELGMHGHRGPNGARGSLTNLSRIGTRSMFGHVHGPGIWQGATAVGTSTVYRMGYNVGPSSWLQTHGIVHGNGYRQLLHIIGRHWRG